MWSLSAAPFLASRGLNDLSGDNNRWSNVRTCIFGEHIPVPRDGWVYEWPRSMFVYVYGKVDGHFRLASPPNVRSQSPRAHPALGVGSKKKIERRTDSERTENEREDSLSARGETDYGWRWPRQDRSKAR
jgi:hypothetical protein